MDNKYQFDSTEEFKELMNEVNEATESLDEEVKIMKREFRHNYDDDEDEDDSTDEVHINDIDDDFRDILKKRKLKRLETGDNKPKKRRLKKWVYALLLALVLLIGGGTYLIIHNKNLAKKEAEEKAILDNIKNHYSDVVKVSKDTSLYDKNNKEIGTIYKGAIIKLVSEEIKKDTKYFHIKDLDYYISFEDVEKSSEKKDSDRYKSYVPFNINVVTKDKFTMYVDDSKYITLNEEMEFPVIINNYENKYYVEYNNTLVSIKKDDVSKTKENKNTDKKNQSKMTTLAYHRVYKEGEKCTDEYVCIKYDNFDKQMKYLVDNKYLTLTTEEFYMYLKGNLQVEKGVMITLDDGLLFINADEVLDKYGLKATGFVTTSLGTTYKNLKAIFVQSHTHDMHRNYVCPGGNQGGALLCASKTKIIEDLKKSIELLGTDPIAFAYPFYDYNDNVIVALKEAGYKMAFVGRAGVLGKATPKVTDLYKIPRMTVYDEKAMSFNEWKGYL